MHSADTRRPAPAPGRGGGAGGVIALRHLPAPTFGDSAGWFVHHGLLRSVDPQDTLWAPPCSDTLPAASAWTGTAFLIWGGVDEETEKLLTDDGFIWTPPGPGRT